MPDPAARRCALIFWLAIGGCASSPPAHGPAVVWVNGPRAYLGSRDSTALSPGDSVEFVARSRTIATGAIASISRGEMATVSIRAGSFEGVPDLRRVTVRISRPAPVTLARLRVGYPSARRGTPLFACARVDLRPPGLAGPYTARDSGSAVIFTRDSSLATVWPLRFEAWRFDDSADEEIALERGEIDVAVFWPGELSAHLRTDPRWEGALAGVRNQGMVAVAWTGDDPDPGSILGALRALEALNRDAFRGDLGRIAPVTMNTEGVSHGPDSLSSVRFDVDARCPGHADLQRALDRLASARGPSLPPRRARLVYLAVPMTATSLRAADGGRVDPVFTVRCPVVCAPEMRRYVSTLSPDSLVNLLDCRDSDAKP